jgi:hypothetical protein
MVKITTWASIGIEPDFNPGRWVQLGSASWFNFLLTGLLGGKLVPTENFPWFKYQCCNTPFSNHKTIVVEDSRLEWPCGFGPDGYIKGLFGQRRIKY